METFLLTQAGPSQHYFEEKLKFVLQNIQFSSYASKQFKSMRIYYELFPGRFNGI